MQPLVDARQLDPSLGESTTNGILTTTGAPVLTPTMEPVTEVVEEAPQEPVKAEELIINETDRLKAENFSLRIQNLAFQRQSFIDQANRKVAEFDTQIMDTRNAIVAFQVELNARYGIDFSKYAIEPGTGRVIPGAS